MRNENEEQSICLFTCYTTNYKCSLEPPPHGSKDARCDNNVRIIISYSSLINRI